MRILKVIYIFLLVIIILSIPSYNYATGMFTDIKGKADGWLEQGQSEITEEEIANIVKPVVNMLMIIGTIVLIVVGLVMGIKYLTASPDEAAKLKVQLIGLVVSAIVIFGAYGIWTLANQIMQSITE